MIRSSLLEKSEAIGFIRQQELKVFERIIKCPLHTVHWYGKEKKDYYYDIKMFCFSSIAQDLMKHCDVQPFFDEPHVWTRETLRKTYRERCIAEGYWDWYTRISEKIPEFAPRIAYMGIPKGRVASQDMLDKKYFTIIEKRQLESVWKNIREFLKTERADWDVHEIDRIFRPISGIAKDPPAREPKTKTRCDWYNNFMMKKQEEKDVIHS